MPVSAEADVVTALLSLLGPEAVLSDPSELRVYECDGFPIARGLPIAVVFPRETREVAEVVKLLRRHHTPIVPRGSGTGLAGGAVAFTRGVIISTSRMTRIEHIDLPNRNACVQSGVLNLTLSAAVAATPGGENLHFSPDPSSQRASTLGGNAATNAGGINTLKHGVTSNHVLAIELVTGEGEVLVTGAQGPKGEEVEAERSTETRRQRGTKGEEAEATERRSDVATRDRPLLRSAPSSPDHQTTTSSNPSAPGHLGTAAPCLHDRLGPDLPGLLCGSEGTLGIITRLWVRLVPKPEHFRTVYAVFNSTRASCQAVSDVIAAGIVPTSMEVMDGAMIRVVEDAFHYGFPTDAGALLLIEIDGIEQALDPQMARIIRICEDNGGIDVKSCSDPQRRAELWSARKRAFGAIGRISPGYCTQDACVPRSKLPDVIEHIAALGAKYGMRINNVFHAGDGNVHPILLFDEDNPEEVQKTLELSEEILDYCISIGGALTGEHGVGVEKIHLMHKMFTPPTLQLFERLKAAFDPDALINDGKLIPSPRVDIQLLHPKLNSPGGAL